MVLDARILGLCEVLYHYNPRLNQFKGRYLFESVYPSPELVAVRLLLVRKLVDGERVDLDALIRRESLLTDPLAVPSPADRLATGLSVEEFRFLREIFDSEPLFAFASRILPSKTLISAHERPLLRFLDSSSRMHSLAYRSAASNWF